MRTTATRLFRVVAHVPLWVRVPAIITLVLTAVLVSATVLSAAGAGGHSQGQDHVAQMTSRTGMSMDHGPDAAHGSGGGGARMGHSADGSGHGAALATPGTK